MLKLFALLIFKILKFLNKIFFLLTKRSYLEWLSFYLINDCYIEKKINKKNIKFYTPNHLISWRVKTLLNKEPDTIEWINNFKIQNGNDFIFWDIGANIGLFSLYCYAIHEKKSKIFAFEPSTSNLRVLSRNIYINNLDKNIKIFSLPLTNKLNSFLTMNEGHFIEGGALNSFGENYNFNGDKFKSKMKYQLFGTTINYLIENNILDLPDYIKIDVDGIEHLILEGGNKFLKNKKIKSLSIEINENFKEQYEKVLNIMNDNGYEILHKKHNKDMFKSNSEFSKTYNYIFNNIN